MNNVAVLLNNKGVDLLTKTNRAASMNMHAGNMNNTNEDNITNNNNNRRTATTINTTDLDRATSYFEQSLSLILRNTEIHKHQGDFFFYESDEQGMIQYEDENIGAQLTNNLNLQDTGAQMNGIDDESFIHWKAVKIGHDETEQMNIDHNNQDGGEYRYLSTSIFHSMICIYNLGLCYQYKGIQTSSRSLLEAAVDHYMQAYELATRFRLQHIDQYMLLMATMNNLATTYSFLNDVQRRDVCNSYLLSTLMLLTTSEEGQEEISASSSSAASTNSKDMLRRRGHQTTFQSFLSNVTYLILQDSAASAA
ncbi:MAG: hypothetical protein ACI8RD_012708 [Bacillariaceae sp.]|jgi:hypothetical protein